MKKSVLLVFVLILALIVVAIFQIEKPINSNKEIELLRSGHLHFLNNSPFKTTENLNKQQRHDLGLPPNKYYEQLWELTMDPKTGRPMPERLQRIKKELTDARAIARGVGDINNPWVDIGPNNEGGRTRGVMFDPNDINNVNPNDDYNRVFAGSVSGGLWVNDDITDANSSWSLINGMDGSIAVNAIITDPNDNKVMYIGSGESYTSGLAIGNGIWKSVDGGITWNNIFGGYAGFSNNNVEGIFYVNDVVARNNAGVTEIFASISPAIYRYSNSPRNTQSFESYGVYKSSDNGLSWQRLNIKDASGLYKNPNDLEIDNNNNVWMTTTRNIDNSAGGELFRSIDGNTFELVNTIPNAQRTELEISENDQDLMWVLANVNGKADLFKSTDGFTTFEAMNEPNDPDEGISATDFARDQAFYNLVIEADEDDNIYVGGIDLFRSLDGGSTWTLLSKWANTSGLISENVSFVHADQHAIIFKPNDSDVVVFGNDGGVYYSSNINDAPTSTDAIQSRNLGYNTIQFYNSSIDITRNEDLTVAGGTQDNGTQLSLRTDTSMGSFIDFFSGDGGFTQLDEDYMIQSYPFNTHNYVNYPDLTELYRLTTRQEENEDFNGSFINEAALDRNLDILYANGSNSNVVRIERISNFKNGEDNIESSFISNSLLDSSPSAMSISPFNSGATNLYIGTRSGKLLKAIGADIAPVWSSITGPEFVGSISDIEFGQNENEIFITIHNYGVDNIWFTSDGGDNWRSLEGDLPDIPVKCILQNPLQTKELIIGTELGVWFCEDYRADNPIWTQSYNGMSDIAVVDLDLRPSDNLVLASTHGRGMFTSNFTAESLSTESLSLNRFQVYPTYSNGRITLKSKENIEEAIISVADISGKIVLKKAMPLKTSGSNLSLKLASGLYFVNINVDNYNETKRVVLK